MSSETNARHDDRRAQASPAPPEQEPDAIAAPTEADASGRDLDDTLSRWAPDGGVVRERRLWRVLLDDPSCFSSVLDFAQKLADGNDEHARELCQIAYCRVLEQGTPRVDLGSHVGYLCAVVANVNRALRRRRQRAEDHLVQEWAESAPGAANPAADVLVSDAEETGVLLGRVEALLPRLAEKQRVYFVEHDLRGRTYAEIAEEHGVRPSTVSGTVSQARSELRRMLGPLDGE